MEKRQSLSGYKVDTLKIKGSGSVPSCRSNLLKTNGAKGGTRTPTGVTPPDPKSGPEKVESLRNIRKDNHLIGFSANMKTERLGSVRNQSGRHLGDSFRGLFPVW